MTDIVQTSGEPIRAAVLRQVAAEPRVEEIRLRATEPADVRVRIERTGVCHSDLSLARGVLAQPLPAVLGHEACGRIVEVGVGVADRTVGQRVLLLWNAPCGHCAFCLAGERWLCASSARLAGTPYALDRAGEPVYAGLSVGSFAEQTVLPATSTVVLPEDVDPAHAALLGCAVTTGVGAVLKTAGVRPGSTVCVLGLGGVGLSAVLGARLADAATIVAVDRSADKAPAAQAMGAQEFLPAAEDLRARAKPLTGGRGFDYVFDCVGSAATIRQAYDLTRRGGTVCVVGVGGKEDRVSFSALELFFTARTIVGTVAGSFDPGSDLDRYLELLRAGEMDLSPLVTGGGGLADVGAAFAAMSEGRGVRVVLTP